MSDADNIPPPEVERSHQCCVCDEPTDKHCKVCNSAHYCSKPCQKKDWQTHKILCTAFADIVRPEGECALALFFPVDESLPRWVWKPHDEEGSTKLVSRLVGAGRGEVVEKSYFGTALNRSARQPVRELVFHSPILWKAKAWNNSILKMTKKGNTAILVAGPWLISVEQHKMDAENDTTHEDKGEEEEEVESKRRPSDMTMDNFRILTEWLEAMKPRQRLMQLSADANTIAPRPAAYIQAGLRSNSNRSGAQSIDELERLRQQFSQM